MKLRPVLVVLLVLVGLYYLSLHLIPAGALAELAHRNIAVEGSTENIRGPLGDFSMTEAAAAPAYDTEEQQNIAVYKRALPSVVNITSTMMKQDFFYGAYPVQGQGSGFVLDREGHLLTNNHVIDGAQIVEVTFLRQEEVQGIGARHRQGPRPGAAADQGRTEPDAGDAGRLVEPGRWTAGVCDRQSVWVFLAR